MEDEELALFVHEVLVRTGHQWKINGVKVEPSVEDVEEMILHLHKDIRAYDSIESGGLLLKRDRGKIDLYVHLGEISEDSSI